MQGRWVPMPSPREETCCGLPDQSILDKDCRQNDLFLNEHNDFRGHQLGLAPMLAGWACACDTKDQYEWQSPSLKPWNPETFCKDLGRRTILLIGDSTMRQTAATLMNAVHLYGCQTQIRMVYSDTLISQPVGAQNRGRHWLTAVNDYQPDIVIVTAGADVYSEANFTRVIDLFISQTHHIQRKFPRVQVIWKTQNPGGCTDEIAPGHPFVTAVTQFKEEKLNATSHISNWNTFWSRDSQVIARLQSQQHHIPFIDMRMLYSRTDQHPKNHNDCLHFCGPGPLSVFPVLLQRLLDTNFRVATCIKGNYEKSNEKQVYMSNQGSRSSETTRDGILKSQHSSGAVVKQTSASGAVVN